MRLGIISFLAMVTFWSSGISGEVEPVPRHAARIVFDGHVSTVHLAQHFTTTIRLPEPVSSVVVGDPSLFQAEHSPNEPLLVFVKPVSAAGETNILISTSAGGQYSLLLKAGGDSGQSSRDIDLLVVCRPTGSSFIEESFPTSLIAETLALDTQTSNRDGTEPATPARDPVSALMEQQRSRPLAELQGDQLKVGIGQVEQRDAQFIVTFSIVNSTGEPVELMPPQIQMAGQVKSGLFGSNSRWTTVDQIPVLDFHLDQRRLVPGARTDGVVVFDRPAFKQSNEGLLLQIADAARVDKPVLVPIRFSVNTSKEGKK